MFATREVKKQTKGFAPSSRKQTSRERSDSTKQIDYLPGSTISQQRYLGNSYLQSMAGGRQTLGQYTTRSEITTSQRKSVCDQVLTPIPEHRSYALFDKRQQAGNVRWPLNEAQVSAQTFAADGQTGTIDPDTGVETITQECCPLYEGEPICHPDKFTVHDCGSRSNGGTQARYRFEYTGRTDNNLPCDCGCCAFVQYVRGVFEINGRQIRHILPGSGLPLSPTTLLQDSPVIPHSGCSVATVGGAPLNDNPGLLGISSTDDVRVDLEFDARTIDTCKRNAIVASRVFTLNITGRHPRAFSVAGDIV